MNCKKNANSNPGEERQLFHPESEKVVEIGLERLRPFKNHPFKVKEDEAMAQLMESIAYYYSQRMPSKEVDFRKNNGSGKVLNYLIQSSLNGLSIEENKVIDHETA